MSADIGTLAVTAAMIVAAAALLAAAVGGRRGSAVAMQRARWLLAVHAGLITLACGALVAALVNGDFRLLYVAGYTERALPVGYRLAAFWAGQEGSVLFWAALVAWMALARVVQARHRNGVDEAATLGTLAIVCGFFAALLLFAANPFATGPAPADGRGLNPLLQDPAMIIHPPLLFIGYAGFTLPLAIMAGALVAGRRDAAWAGELRRWTLFAWLFLSAGILLGAEWAYVELGWGGYWAWDPVENASLLPWLTGTALLHSIVIQQQRGMFRRWNGGLVSATFLLCIFGTYLTRSGIVQSVHGFGASLVGTFFLVFLVTMTAGCIGLLIWRRDCLAPDAELEQLVSKEGAFLGINVLLVLMTIITLLGTIWPVLTGLVREEAISVGPPFYNRVVVPLMLALVALMAFGPLLASGPDALRRLLQEGQIPVAAGLVAVAAALALGLRDGWALVCTFIAATGLTAVTWAWIRDLRQHLTLSETGTVPTFFRMIDNNHRRYGGQVVHVGIILIVIGVAGSSLFGVKEEFQASAGDTTTVGRYTLAFDGTREVRGPNYTAVEADVTLVEPDGRRIDLTPQMRFYDKSEQPHSEVALRWTLRDDVYVTLAGWEEGGRVVALQAMVNPLVVWIWIGSIVLVLGTTLCLLPPLARLAVRRPAPVAPKAGISLPLTTAHGRAEPCSRQ